MSLPAVSVEVALFGLAVESMVEFVLDKTGVVVKAVVLIVESAVAMPIKPVKTDKIGQMAWDAYNTMNTYNLVTQISVFNWFPVCFLQSNQAHPYHFHSQ